MKHFKKNIITYFELALLFFTAFYNFQHFNVPKIEGNAASRILLAVGPLFDIGAPYKDLYEFVPPGFLIFATGWIGLFGTSMNSFRFLQVFFIVLSGLCILLLCKKIFQRRALELFVFFVTIISLHSGIIQTDLFPIDFLGTTLALSGLTALLYIKDLTLRISISITMILLASQMKDIYIVPIIALTPFYFRELLRDKRSFFRLLCISLIGPLLLALLIVTYLLTTGALEGYLQIMRDKAAFAQYGSIPQLIRNFGFMIYTFEKFFLRAQGLIGGLLLVNILLILSVYFRKLQKSPLFKKKKFVRTYGKSITLLLNNYGETKDGRIVLIVTYSISLLSALTLYGHYSVDTRFGSIVFSLFFLIGILTIYPTEIIRAYIRPIFPRALVLIIFLSLFLPQRAIFKSYEFTSNYKGNYSFEVERAIIKKTNKNDCILHVYGWGVAPTYIYTKRRPCSRYFLPNSLHQVRRSNLASEYREHIFINPPSLIVYTTELTDFDIKRFEQEVINLPSVLSNCYSVDPKYKNHEGYILPPITLYWANSTDKKKLKECFIKYGQPTGDKNPDKIN